MSKKDDQPRCPFTVRLGGESIDDILFNDGPIDDLLATYGLRSGEDVEFNPFIVWILMQIAWKVGYETGAGGEAAS